MMTNSFLAVVENHRKVGWLDALGPSPNNVMDSSAIFKDTRFILSSGSRRRRTFFGQFFSLSWRYLRFPPPPAVLTLTSTLWLQ